MGLTTWKNAPEGENYKSDVSIAKNYLTEDELESLNRIVTMYLDYAELQAKNKKVMYMADWAKKLDSFSQFNERDILQNNEKITNEIAKIFAEKEWEQYRQIQDQLYRSDFDLFLENAKKFEK